MEAENLVVSMAATEVEEEECATPRDSGSRIPTPMACPPAPRKNPRAVFDVKGHKRMQSEEEEGHKEFRFEEGALELIFALRTAKNKMIIKKGKDQQGSFFGFSDSESFSN